MSRPNPRVSACVFALLPLLLARSVLAGSPSDVAAAQGLYDEARKLMKAGQYAAACPKLEESQRLDRSTSTEFHLADCYEHTSRPASAWALFLQVASESKSAGRGDAERLARQRANDLAPKVSRLTVTVPSGSQVDGLQVKRDAEVVGQAQWGSAVPVDPGKHTIAATASGRIDWSTTVEVGEAKPAIVEVPALVLAPLPPVAVAPPSDATSPASASPTQSEAGNDAARSGSRRRTIGLVVVGAGIVALGVGTYFGLQALSKNSDSHRNCSGNDCRLAGFNERNDARSTGDLSTALVLAGAAAVAGGAVLWLTAPRHVASAAAGAPFVRVGLAPAGVFVQGAFQ
jgi:serine/threonine-protein kinase